MNVYGLRKEGHMVRPLLLAAATFVLVGGLLVRQPSAATQTASDFVGAATCQTCHADIHKAWSATKHARAFGRLGPDEAASGKCIKCHVTGTPEQIAAEGAKPSLPGVQCESCHGAGRAHVEAAKGGDASNARTKRIEELTCTACHNDTSPHYKPFFFGAMKGLVHRPG
jgi:hypothetical protein